MKRLCDWIASRKRGRCQLKSVGEFVQQEFLLDNVVNIVNSPKVGPEYYQHVGNCIDLLRLSLCGSIQLTYNNAVQYREATGFMSIVYDRQPNGSVPAMSDIFAQKDQNGIANDSFFPVNPVNVDRFDVLWYKVFGFPAIGAYGANSSENSYVRFADVDKEVIDLDLDLAGLSTVFGGGTDGLVTNVRTGQLWLVMYNSNPSIVNGAAFKFYGAATLFYEDA